VAVERKWRLTDIGLCPYGETETVSHINNNKCIGDDTKAAARQSPKYINKTSSSAVAKRSCDPSCLSLFSFNSSLQNVEQSLLLLVTYATDLSLRAIKCCLWRNVETSSSSSSNKVHPSISRVSRTVINISPSFRAINKHRGLLPAKCHNLRDGGPTASY